MKSLRLGKPHILIMVGIPGSGKTFFAEKFAETFHAPFISYEKIRSLCGSPDTIEAIALYQLDELLKTRQSIIIEGGTDMRRQRIELAKKARAAGYDALVIWVQTDQPTAKNRALKASKEKGYPVDTEDFDRVVKQFSAPAPQEKPVVISGRHTYASQAKVVLQRLTSTRAASVKATPPTREERPNRRNIMIR